MKRINGIICTAAALLTGALCLQSCLDDDDNDYRQLYANAVVTLKTNADNTRLLIQLDDDTQLTATNVKSPLYGGKEVRALANLSNIDREKGTAYVNWIDSILTKNTAANLGDANSKKYGDDPVEIVKSFETVAEDGYLTLRFRTYWGGSHPHTVNLVHRTDANTPYLLRFYHNANGDPSHGTVGDGYVAFRLPEAFNAEDDTITIQLQYMSFRQSEKDDSLKTISLKYKPRKK